MLAELLKNACRATLNKHMKSADDVSTSLPSIRVILVRGKEDVTIKVADQGGGVPRSELEKIFTFSHSKPDSEVVKTAFLTDYLASEGLRGFGLPLVRIYASYFGGSLTLKSMEGYGLDAYLHLPVLGVACENMPERVAQSPANLESN